MALNQLGSTSSELPNHFSLGHLFSFLTLYYLTLEKRIDKHIFIMRSEISKILNHDLNNGLLFSLFKFFG